MVPSAWFLAFAQGIGLKGLFAGIVVGSSVHAATNLVLVLRLIDFDLESQRAVHAANAAGGAVVQREPLLRAGTPGYREESE